MSTLKQAIILLGVIVTSIVGGITIWEHVKDPIYLEGDILRTMAPFPEAIRRDLNEMIELPMDDVEARTKDPELKGVPKETLEAARPAFSAYLKKKLAYALGEGVIPFSREYMTAIRLRNSGRTPLKSVKVHDTLGKFSGTGIAINKYLHHNS